MMNPEPSPRRSPRGVSGTRSRRPGGRKRRKASSSASFDTLAAGTSALEFRPGVAGSGAFIGDALGNARAAFTTSGSLTVTAPPDPIPDPVGVPEPGTLGLMGLAIAFMGLTRRRPLVA